MLSSLKGPGMHLPIIVGIVLVRYIAFPAVGIGIVKGAIHFGLILPDPLYQFVLLLHFAVPSAIAISCLWYLKICFFPLYFVYQMYPLAKLLVVSTIFKWNCKKMVMNDQSTKLDSIHKLNLITIGDDWIINFDIEWEDNNMCTLKMLHKPLIFQMYTSNYT